MVTTSISRKLLSRVLSLYFVLTFIVTGVQIIAEYYNAKSNINSELLTLERTFSGSLTRAVWELNTDQVNDIANGLVAIPMIRSIVVTNENNEVIVQYGDVERAASYTKKEGDSDKATYFSIQSFSQGTFGHTFPLIFEFSGRNTQVGSVTLLSSNQVIFNRIEIGLYFLIGNAMLKTAALILLFTLAFNSLLTTPLNSLTDQIRRFDIDDPESSKINSQTVENNELKVLENAYNNLIDQLVLYKEELADAQEQILQTNQKLDEHNLMLEQEVAKKASSLSSNMLKMELQQRDLIEQQKRLEDENERRKRTEHRLLKTNKDLTESIEELNKAQVRLLEAEKMASLGNLAAEVSHEVNTPVGISITSASYLADLLDEVTTKIKANDISPDETMDYCSNAQQSIDLLMNNLKRASELIASFKQVAVDQTSNKVREINLKTYIDEVVNSLQPRLKGTNHQINVNCPNNLNIFTHAGALSQIFTNLIMNSVIHGFDGRDDGNIDIDITMENERIKIDYHDDGHGLTSEQLAKLFEQFYTTKENEGGSGLGTHIIQNLVIDNLNGQISAHSEVGQGLHYHIEFNNMR
ncbi:sensor histidine kinase [Thalassotalea sp. LPB0316]|uniref:sensor histidine kinase n=1 Tax=Thalassotalea sp. LPB0316 TaxID=2769490 RepID=UPI001868B108|nr:HAMP domain-containing sensor histidine kinase [Thalassotalea sp. LPB0316]QOL27010.1 sensor histidine kinase [Thalassotalea sp. LPB0316]